MTQEKEQKTGETNNLFRKEATVHLGSATYGTVLLTQPISHRLLSILFFSLGFVIILFFALFETTRKAQTQGVLLPTSGLIKILPMQAGIIIESRVKEGQIVARGDVLFVLSGERSIARVDSPQRTISNLLESRRDSFSEEIGRSEAQQNQRRTLLRRKVNALEEDIARIDTQVKMQQARTALAIQSLKRFSDLQSKNYISAAQLQEKQGELIDQEQRLADLRRGKSAAQRDLLNTVAELDDLTIQAQRDMANLRRNVASLEQELTESEARREIHIRATHAGTIGAITAVPGQGVTAGTVLASLSPAGYELEAEVYAPSRAVGFIKPGMPVLVRYQAYPYQKFGQYPARVTEVAHTALSPQELSVPGAASQSAEPLYRIRLKLEQQFVTAYGKHIPLKAGMIVDASVALENRKLYEWVLEPLFSVSGRL